MESKENKKVVKTKKENKIVKDVKLKKEITDLKGNVIKKDVPPKKSSNKGALKKHVAKYKKLYLLTLLIIIIITSIIFAGILIRNYILNKKYKEYEKKMDAYGFEILYDNKSAKSSQKLTRLEAVKIAISAAYNQSEVESIGFAAQGKFEGDQWAKTAEAFGITPKGFITEKNYNEKATYWETIMICLNARKVVQKKDIGVKTEGKFKNLSSFTEEQRRYINDAAHNGLIPNNKKSININSEVFKGQFNQLIVNFIEKYNTIVPEGETIVTKNESMPSNSNIYPYILYSVKKEAYEYKGVNEGGVDYKSPVETYKHRKDYYDQVVYRTEHHYNTMINIDYKTITEENFKEKMDKYLKYYYDDKLFSDYVKYVKENKIQIEGKATVQLPVFYLDGILFRARVKLSFEVLNSNTDKNIMFADSLRSKEVTYKNKKYEVYIDAPMGESLTSKGLRLNLSPIIDLLVSDVDAHNKNQF